MKKSLVFLCLIIMALVSCKDKPTVVKLELSTPEFSFEEGVYNNSLELVMSSDVTGATIKFTVDGSEPDINSQQYVSPVIISNSCVVKAKAFKSGWTESKVNSAVYIFQTGKPVFSINGGEFNETQTIEITSVTEHAEIYYTLDGTEPTQNSILYTSPLNIIQNIIIKAKAYRGEWENSEEESKTFTFKVKDPVFSIDYAPFSDAQIVNISTETENAVIRYTIDSSEPDSTSAIFENSFEVSNSTVLKAIAYKENWIESNISVMESLRTLVFSVSEGTYKHPVSIEISYPESKIKMSKHNQVTIRYTLDGSEPNQNSNLYTDPIKISKYTVLKAKAFQEDWFYSETKVAIYDFLYNLNINIYPEGAGTVTGEGIYSAGHHVKLTTSTNQGFAFLNLTLNGQIITEDAFFNYIIPEEDLSITANFQAIPDFVLVEGGTFSPNNGTYIVTLSPFYMSTVEVSQRDWQIVMTGNTNTISTNPSYFSGKMNNPVDNITWKEIVVFCNRKSILDGLTPVYLKDGVSNPDLWYSVNLTWDNLTMDLSANGYRMPTEMEWEWAARGGAIGKENGTFDTMFAGSNDIERVAWYFGNNGPMGSINFGTKASALKAPNELGLYDMTGNVGEWCWDWLNWQYPSGSFLNPTGPNSPTYINQKAWRGGKWDTPFNFSKVSVRNDFSFNIPSVDKGARLVRNIPHNDND